MKIRKRWLYFIIAGVGVGIVIVLTRITPLFERSQAGRCSIRLTRQILDHSLKIGAQFMLTHQKPEGNFTYEYNWIEGTYTDGDNQARQAGAMWGLALIYQDDPNSVIGEAVERAFAFFEKYSRTTADGRLYVAYPGDSEGRTGTVALCALAYIDYLHANPPIPEDLRQRYKHRLDGYIQFLIGARTPDGLWHSSFNIADRQPFGAPSPYFDGESLLALVKAAKYAGREDLRPIIIESAEAGYRRNVQEALQQDPDSPTTKGYYQWSSMAFYELAASGWPDTEKYGDYVIELAEWMIDVHKTLKRRRNTGYAYEGIIHANQLAVLRKDKLRIQKFGCVIDRGLEKLISWQVGSLLENAFIRQRAKKKDSLSIGGVQNHAREAPLRIDVAQHQMHAVILARRYVYKMQGIGSRKGRKGGAGKEGEEERGEEESNIRQRQWQSFPPFPSFLPFQPPISL
jgi:UDP-N-acetylmuramoyl-tripeptide--D-alanyl-D-alanine ligase